MKLRPLLFILASSVLSAQSFSYERSWATYYGGISSGIREVYEDSSMNLSVSGSSAYPGGSIIPSIDYYNQFVSPGGNLFTAFTNPSINKLIGQFSPSGALTFAEYHPQGNSYAEAIYPILRDEQGNQYEIEFNINSFPALSFGTWLSTHTLASDIILAKYDANGTLLWKTFLPSTGSVLLLKADSTGNVYFTGSTAQQNLGDPGTYHPGFATVYDSTGTQLLDNHYVVKLNPQGQKVWATYIPTQAINDIEVSEGKLYIAGNADLDTNASELATPGTFQQSKAGQSITCLNTLNGQRLWGTYYGVPGNSVEAGVINIRANATGVYMVGNTWAPGNYYATENAYKTSTTDGFDFFLTKFNDSGNRIWSTYLGSDGYEVAVGYKSSDIKDDKILISGLSSGNHNMASPGAFVSTKPSPGFNDLFFSMFNASGEHIFTSYYGGSHTTTVVTQSISPSFSENSDGFYLYGNTENQNGFTTSNGNQQSIILPSGFNKGIAGFIAKFSPKTLSTSDTAPAEDLVVYNNPSNGNFTLKGSVLKREPHLVTLHDLSGKLIYSKHIRNNATQQEHFNLEPVLTEGNYLLSVKKADETLIKTFKLTIRK
ncbi:T9SS type A sorting domain-containing protein [Chryseobacterium camelliae]|uniref:T9SS type A sorting domain-containing protein n=1 Tax=Chryseobacterium camelliae TaxID=1265445 RepID=UPI000C1C8E18|nr:T9SS type A sorting domain-containing protein [Chryseobacterium camelliae]